MTDGGAGPQRRRSAEAMERGRRLLPGGVDSPVRAYRAVGGDPVVLASGRQLFNATNRATDD